MRSEVQIPTDGFVSVSEKRFIKSLWVYSQRGGKVETRRNNIYL